jgi:hypothetical protein
MPALVAGIHIFPFCKTKDVDGRNKPGHDNSAIQSELIMLCRMPTSQN